MTGYLMAMLLGGFCKISTFADILSHTGRPFKEGWDTGSGVTLTNADRNDGDFDTKIEQKLRNGWEAKPSKLSAIIACC